MREINSYGLIILSTNYRFNFIMFYLDNLPCSRAFLLFNMPDSARKLLKI